MPMTTLILRLLYQKLHRKALLVISCMISLVSTTIVAISTFLLLCYNLLVFINCLCFSVCLSL